MNRKNKNGFTLVELLAVIVILAIILVMAVPKIMNVIKDTTKASLESSAKMVAAQVENQYTVAQTLSKEFASTGSCMQDWAGLNEYDYTSCSYEITNDGTAKVTLVGEGKFKGLSVCSGTRSSATATESICLTTPVRFETDSWETIVSAVKQAETNGTEYPYNVGDEKTIDLGTTLGTHTIRVSNKTKCNALQTVPVSKTACGFVLEFADVITTHYMNPSGDYNGKSYQYGYNIGGWPNSKMREYLNNIVLAAFPDALEVALKDTYVVSSRGSGTITGYENVVEGNFYSTDKLYLLSPEEVYGTSITGQYDLSSGTSRQLDYYANYEGDGYKGVSITNIAGAKKYNGSTTSQWWLRSAISDGGSTFYIVGSNGGSHYTDYASSIHGVSPAFRLAN